MSIEIIRKDNRKTILRNKINGLNVREFQMKNGLLIGVPKGEYQDEDGIRYKFSGKPIDVNKLPIGPAEIINMVGREYCKKNKLHEGAIYWRQEWK